jgi:hypothetical protein
MPPSPELSITQDSSTWQKKAACGGILRIGPRHGTGAACRREIALNGHPALGPDGAPELAGESDIGGKLPAGAVFLKDTPAEWMDGQQAAGIDHNAAAAAVFFEGVDEFTCGGAVEIPREADVSSAAISLGYHLKIDCHGSPHRSETLDK